MHSHYHKASQTWFTLDTCETCGQDIQAPNAVKTTDAKVLKRWGIKFVDELPPEGWWNDDLGQESCDGCQGDDISAHDGYGAPITEKGNNAY